MDWFVGSRLFTDVWRVVPFFKIEDPKVCFPLDIKSKRPLIKILMGGANLINPELFALGPFTFLSNFYLLCMKIIKLMLSGI